MKKVVVTVNDVNGLHARPAAKIVETCKALSSKVTLYKGANVADGCSILDVLLLAAENGSSVEIVIEGGNESLSMKKVAELFDNGGGI